MRFEGRGFDFSLCLRLADRISDAVSIRVFYSFRGMSNPATTGLDRSQDRVEPIFKILTREPRHIYQANIVNAAQFKFEAIDQILCRILQLAVAVFHVQALTGKFDPPPAAS